MSARGSQASRFDAAKKFFANYKAGYMSLDEAKKNMVDTLQYAIYESELDKFAEKNPEIPAEEIKTFLTSIGALKKAGSKKKKDGVSGAKTRLNTAEAAIERGVAPDKVAEYLTLVDTVYTACKQLRELTDDKTSVSFAMPVEKPKPVATEAPAEAQVSS